MICLARHPIETCDSGIECVAADLANLESFAVIRPYLDRIDAVFHLAACLPAQPPADESFFFKVNSLATIQLLRMAADAKVPAFVYASSIGVIGKPEILPISEGHPVKATHSYFVSKLCAELYCEMVRSTEKVRATSLRITSPYGPGMPSHTVLAKFVSQALRSENMFWFGSGGRRQNFVHVRDVVHACLLAAKTADPGVYNAAGDGSISMRNLAELVAQLTPGSRSVPQEAGKADPQDDYYWDIDHSRSQKGLGYSPRVSLRDGLKEYIESVQTGGPAPGWWRKANYENSASR